jgi:chromosome segregation ATPase
MGEYRKSAQRRMHDAEVEWRKWHKVVAKDAKSMVGDMLVELDNRHQKLLSEFSAAGQRRDAVARKMAGIQKEIQSVQKAMTRGDVNWESVSERLLDLARAIGGIRAGFAGVESTLRRIREQGPSATEIIDHLTEEIQKERLNWDQSASAFEHIYIELESAHLPPGIQDANDYIEHGMFEPQIARARNDDSPAAVAAVTEELHKLLYPNEREPEPSGAEIAAEAGEKLLPSNDEEVED